jgi:hypothetical protein
MHFDEAYDCALQAREDMESEAATHVAMLGSSCPAPVLLPREAHASCALSAPHEETPDGRVRT